MATPFNTSLIVSCKGRRLFSHSTQVDKIRHEKGLSLRACMATTMICIFGMTHFSDRVSARGDLFLNPPTHPPPPKRGLLKHKAFLPVNRARFFLRSSLCRNMAAVHDQTHPGPRLPVPLPLPKITRLSTGENGYNNSSCFGSLIVHVLPL